MEQQQQLLHLRLPYALAPPLVGLDVVQVNFGMSLPFQEISEDYYTIKKLTDVSMNDFDALQIPGAFCPYNILESGKSLEFLK